YFSEKIGLSQAPHEFRRATPPIARPPAANGFAAARYRSPAWPASPESRSLRCTMFSRENARSRSTADRILRHLRMDLLDLLGPAHLLRVAPPALSFGQPPSRGYAEGDEGEALKQQSADAAQIRKTRLKRLAERIDALTEKDART